MDELDERRNLIKNIKALESTENKTCKIQSISKHARKWNQSTNLHEIFPLYKAFSRLALYCYSASKLGRLFLTCKAREAD